MLVEGEPDLVLTFQGGRGTALMVQWSMGNMANLRELWLSENSLTGEIPAELSQLSELTTLNLSDNQLEGEIPRELALLENLESLFLANNRFDRTDPPGVCPPALEICIPQMATTSADAFPAELYARINFTGRPNHLPIRDPSDLGDCSPVELGPPLVNDNDSLHQGGGMRSLLNGDRQILAEAGDEKHWRRPTLEVGASLHCQARLHFETQRTPAEVLIRR